MSAEEDPRYAGPTQIAKYYVYGIPAQRDQNSPTGWWMGQLVGQGNDWECYAGLASAVMGHKARLPAYVRRLYDELLDD